MTKLYDVRRVAPAACPACHEAFTRDDVFGSYAPGHGASFVQAAADAVTRFPEVDESRTDGVPDFMRCSRCANVTLCLRLADRLVRTREEAERLLEEGYTAFNEVEALGDVDALIEAHAQFESSTDGVRRGGAS